MGQVLPFMSAVAPNLMHDVRTDEMVRGAPAEFVPFVHAKRIEARQALLNDWPVVSFWM